MNNFDELKLSEPLQKALLEMGYTAPTPIQAQTLPILLGNKGDFVGMAATGTGKTAAFGIPLLERIDPEKREIQGVVLCPTRELAIQVSEQITLMGKHKHVHAQAIYGGAGYSDQIRGIKRGAFIVVATPGRLIDHIRQGNRLYDDFACVNAAFPTHKNTNPIHTFFTLFNIFLKFIYAYFIIVTKPVIGFRPLPGSNI